MNILHVITHGGWAGSESIAAGIANEQAVRGHDVTVILRRHEAFKSKEIVNNFHKSINIFWVEQAETHPEKQILTLLKNDFFVKKITEVEIFHAHLPYGCLLGKLLKEKFLVDFKICVSMHVRYHPLYYFADKIFTVAKWQQQEIPKDFDGEVFVVENFLSDHKVNNEKRLKLFKRKYYINDENKYIIYIGRLDLVKGPDVLIRAFNKAKPEGYKLIIIGDGPEAKSLKAMASENVIFTGKIFDASFALEVADMCVVPSRFESFGLVLLEAVNAGKRIIATDIPSFNEILGNSDLLFKNENISSLAKKITDYAINPNLGFANNNITNEFSLSRSLDKLEVAYATLDIINIANDSENDIKESVDELEAVYNV